MQDKITSKITEIDKNKIESAFFKEYINIKENHPNMMVMFQIGDFIETFLEDAKLFSQICGIALTQKPVAGIGKVLMAGVNRKQINLYLKQILNENIKICYCEEFKDEKDNNYREVTRIYTQGTIIESEFLNSKENNFIAVVNKFENEFHFSYADISDGQFYKTTGNYNEITNEIEKIAPNELLLNISQYDLFEELANKFNTTVIGEECFINKKIEDVIIEYCSKTQKKFKVDLEKAKEYKINNWVILDEITRRNLEITRTQRYLKKEGSLYWFLNNTKTPMGARLIKKYLREPLLNLDIIKERQNLTEKLKENESLLDIIEKHLENFSDLSRICAKISNTTILPKDLIQIAQNSTSLDGLLEVFSSLNFNIGFENKIISKLKNFIELIKKSIKEEPSDELKSGNIIKEGYDARLDLIKNNINKTTKQINELEKNLKDKFKIDKLQINYSRIIGYYIEIPKNKENLITNNYIKKQTLQNSSRYTNQELKEKEEIIYKDIYQANELEYELYCKIRLMAKEFIEDIRIIAKDVAKIDVIASYARCAIINNLIKPEFNNNHISIVNGYHPSLLKLNNQITKNDTYLNEGKTIILTGSNMSGKSTYLKQNAIIMILAQIGAFVPADSASLKIIDKIFLRQGSTDDIINNNSSFMVEMEDLKYIIDNVSNSSLVLLDEPAKSTSSKEGGAIAKAYIEYLAQNYTSYNIVATHNLELTTLEEKYPNIENYCMGEIKNNILNRKIKKGVINSSEAINTAILANLPEEIIEKAKSYLTLP